MGKYKFTQVFEYGRIQCDCRFSTQLLFVYSYLLVPHFKLITALLPSTTTGLVESSSIMQPIRHILRYKKTAVQFFEADCTSVDPVNKTLTITGIHSYHMEVTI